MKKTSLIKIGKNIQKIRKSNGYTQEKLAEEIEEEREEQKKNTKKVLIYK